MKNVIVIVIVVLFPYVAGAQALVDLDYCKSKARENYPKLKQAELFVEISHLNSKNHDVNYLPTLNLKGQATYQSEVVEIDLPIPGFEFDALSKDQYKLYVELQQTIWDGGLTKASKKLVDIGLESQLQELEVEANQVLTMVEGYFFAAIMADKSIDVLQVQVDVLKKQIESVGLAVEHGAVREKDKLKLEMEEFSLQQKIIEVNAQKASVLAVLSVLMGEELGVGVKLVLPDVSLIKTNELLRPEFKYFELQRTRLDHSDNLLGAARNPLFYGFGQAGYGKPGFNMLKNEFDPYYLVGVGLSWRITDWKTTRRKKEINKHQRSVIETLQADFEMKQQMELVDQMQQVEHLEKILEVDSKLLEGRSVIAQTAANEFKNGSITSTDYLIDLNAETVAKINNEIHKIQLIQAISKYNTILGY